MPDLDIDVDLDEGRLPAYDVDWAKVNVGTRTTTVEVPKVVVVMEEETIEVPVVDVAWPSDNDDFGATVERPLTVSAEVTGESAELDIEEVYAMGSTLYVLAKLENSGQDLGDQKMRVEDRIYLNAPEDFNVKYYIMGERPNRSYNNNFMYIKDRSDLDDRLENAKKIYG